MNKKRLVKGLTIVALLAIVAVGATLAYLTNVTDTKTNTFSSSGKVVGKIEETEWDKTHKDGWTDYQPGEATVKDPKVTLDANSEDAWVGMQLDFKDASGTLMSYDKFSKYAAYDAISEGWVKVATNGNGSELWAYKTAAVTKGTSSPTLFNNITVSAGITTVGTTSTTDLYKRVITKDTDGKITSDVLTKIEGTPETNVAYFDADGNPIGTNDTLPSFSIDAKGYAVQSAGKVDFAAAVAEMIKLANTGKTGSDVFTAI